MVGRIRPHLDPDAERDLFEGIARRGGSEWACELRGCLSVLIDLMHDNCQTSVPELQDAVRRIVFEHTDIDEGGDAQHHDTHTALRQIEVVINELERIRRKRINRGDWSQVPCPPLMFG